MILTANTISIAPNRKIRFHAKAGVAPYLYTVEADGVGGSINAVTGEYTAPAAYGKDTIKVVDSDIISESQTLDIFVRHPLELFCDIVQKEMGLDDGRVYLFDQKINQPKDNGLYIAVSVLNPKAFSSTNVLGSDGKENLSINMNVQLSLDIISRGLDALLRKEEVIMAFNSDYSRNQQALNSFYIAPLPNGFNNLSSEDGPAIPYRYNMTVQMQYSFTKNKVTLYYDNFQSNSILSES